MSEPTTIFESKSNWLNIPCQEIQLPYLDSTPYVWISWLDGDGEKQTLDWQEWEHFKIYNGQPGTSGAVRSISKWLTFTPGQIAASIPGRVNEILKIKFGAVWKPGVEPEPGPFTLTHQPVSEDRLVNGAGTGIYYRREQELEFKEHFGDEFEGELKQIYDCMVTHRTEGERIVPVTTEVVYLKAEWVDISGAKCESAWQRFKSVYADKTSGKLTAEFTPEEILKVLKISTTARKIKLILGVHEEEKKGSSLPVRNRSK